jgi:glycosyltransferase involved in cell wall biosynthesis
MKTKELFKFSAGMVVPCYNEQERLQLSEFSRFFKKDKTTFFCFVDDGSTDGTKKIIADFANKHPERVQAVFLSCNQGKAEAVRQGVKTLLKTHKFKFVGYWDADLATPLSTIIEFIEKVQSNRALVAVCGSRILRLGADIRRSVFRHYLGRIFATVASNILNIPVYDTQCGAKLFSAEHAEYIFSEHFISRWFFDIELFARSIELMGREKTVNTIYELPLSKWHDVGKSKVTWGSIIMTPLDLFRIFYHYRHRIANSPKSDTT